LLSVENDLGISVSHAVQTIEATIADIEIAPQLEVQVGDPLMKVERTVYGIDERPIEFVSLLYRADKYCFTVKLDRKKSDEFKGWSTAR
jgi:GntR family transcriptional regulator